VTRRALVTGATGFLGSHLARSLSNDGWQVTALQRSSSADSPSGDRLRSFGVDVVTFDAMGEVQDRARSAEADIAFHLATHYLKDHEPHEVSALLEANVSFGAHLLEGLKGTPTSVVSALSYFQFSGGAPAPVSLYSATKQAFFDISEYYRVVAGMDITQVVIFDTFGPGDTRKKLVPQLMTAFAEGRPLALGPARQLLNLLYVDDVVAGLMAAASHRGDPVVTLRSPQNVTVGELVSALGVVSGRSVDCHFNDAASPNEALLHAGEWRTPEGWAPPRSLIDGLEATWRVAAGT